jgi:hypothetical protein
MVGAGAVGFSLFGEKRGVSAGAGDRNFLLSCFMIFPQNDVFLD